MAEVKNKTLVKKLVEVSRAIGYLQKDKKNMMQNYSYLSEAKIKETIKKQFEEQGIVFNYSTEEVREYEISPTHKGTKQFVTIANGTYQFIDSDSAVDISGKWFGSGSDTGDKGLYKAITGGIKYVLNTNFLIPTGDDPENDGGDNGKEIGKPKTKTTPKIGKDNGSGGSVEEFDHLVIQAFGDTKGKVVEAFLASIRDLPEEEQIKRLKIKVGVK